MFWFGKQKEVLHLKVIMIILFVLALSTLGYDVGYLYDGKSGEHIPFLYPVVFGYLAFCMKISKDLPPLK